MGLLSFISVETKLALVAGCVLYVVLKRWIAKQGSDIDRIPIVVSACASHLRRVAVIDARSRHHLPLCPLFRYYCNLAWWSLALGTRVRCLEDHRRKILHRQQQEARLHVRHESWSLRESLLVVVAAGRHCLRRLITAFLPAPTSWHVFTCHIQHPTLVSHPKLRFFLRLRTDDRRCIARLCLAPPHPAL